MNLTIRSKTMVSDNARFFFFSLDLDNGCLLTSDSINPQVDFVADYKIEGKVLLLPVKGSGRSNITMCKYIFAYILSTYIL